MSSHLTPASNYVEMLGMRGAMDQTVWTHACEHDFMMVSKDDDFRNLALVRGAPL